jgi:hypothetical protein
VLDEDAHARAQAQRVELEERLERAVVHARDGVGREREVAGPAAAAGKRSVGVHRRAWRGNTRGDQVEVSVGVAFRHREQSGRGVNERSDVRGRLV